MFFNQPNLRFDEVDSNNSTTYTYITPNVAEPFKDWNGQSIEHPLRDLRIDVQNEEITSSSQWRDPDTWRISVNKLENILETNNGLEYKKNY